MKTSGIGCNDPCPCGSGKKFKYCCLGKESGTASGHGAAGISETLRTALEDRQFNSLQEAQAFLDQITQQQNRRQLDEFHGLSPEQMHQILNFPFASQGLVRFEDVLDANPVAPVLNCSSYWRTRSASRASNRPPRATCRATSAARPP